MGRCYPGSPRLRCSDPGLHALAPLGPAQRGARCFTAAGPARGRAPAGRGRAFLVLSLVRSAKWWAHGNWPTGGWPISRSGRLEAERAAAEHATELAHLKEEGKKVANFRRTACLRRRSRSRSGDEPIVQEAEPDRESTGLVKVLEAQLRAVMGESRKWYQPNPEGLGRDSPDASGEMGAAAAATSIRAVGRLKCFGRTSGEGSTEVQGRQPTPWPLWGRKWKWCRLNPERIDCF